MKIERKNGNFILTSLMKIVRLNRLVLGLEIK